MPAKSRFTRLDAFTKTVEDARIRTTSGGVVTITSLLVIFWLVWGEWADYRRVIVRPELVVDKGRGEKMEISMNITFPRLPCELLTLDVMDVSGEMQMGVMHGINKVRLRPENEGSTVIETKALELHKDEALHLDPEYCGECYGAPPPPAATKSGCCNTCEEVREAYASISWSFGRGEGVEQCEREHYAEHLDEQRREGCRLEGGIRVNKVIGNFHIAPGKSFSNGNLHVHDLENYFKDEGGHTFTHTIHHLRFGPQLSDVVIQKMQKSHAATGPGGWTSHHINPLDNTDQHTDEKAYNFMYFVKVVSTAYLPLGWEKQQSMSSKYTDTLGATIDANYKGSIETHQYSVTSHKRSLQGGSDEEAGHKERIHARGGIPGVFFSYDISPMKVINREVRAKSFSGFLVGLCAVIGGTLTVAAAVDRAVYEGVNKVKKMHSS
ncbi:endoplasmic reticulum-golgi intermediate compartment protein-like protein 3 [Lindgomyces ingoldianus]|uniref:Endoplasmic reticulum-golgi intermediate compartment protein-like protein 3 n=1 Tax=Lindgomyces ingoldianus TaxID=673940 RepID=A0ACB6QPT0_9PLEO|nr:endoplasmic reticulum-golgi intermediate compartment protein-like protein 3 [Lindgomyces ingoldianus]KAF2468112.1 endoplasmic reticulum-golgi intermediate compartment protein-like protein 3 [Lindgomyces ingoldianus]